MLSMCDFIQLFLYFLSCILLCVSAVARYLSVGGEPFAMVDLLSANFTSLAGMVNVMANWLIGTGMPAGIGLLLYACLVYYCVIY